MKPILKYLPANKLPAIRFSEIFQKVVLLLSPFLVYALVLTIRYDYPIRPVSKMLRGGFTFIFPALALIFFLVFLLPGWWGRLGGITVALLVFGFTLVGLWASGQSEYYLVSGLIPFVDASDYFNDARRLLEGRVFSEFSSWRPLFPAFLAPILGLVGRGVQASVAVLVGVAAIACYLLARETQKIYGTAAAAFVMLIGFFYYRPYDGSLVPENLGFALGALGFGLLLSGANNHDRGKTLLGIFMLSLGLFSRPGAFFVLVAVVFWGGWLFRGEGRISWTNFAWACLAAAAGFLIYLSAGWLFYGAPQIPLSYFARHIFYDLAVGYPLKGGGQIISDFPAIASQNGVQINYEIIRLALSEIRQQPELLLSGIGLQYRYFLAFGWYAVYGYLISGTPWITWVVYIGMYVLCVLGIIRWILDRKDPVSSLVFWAAVASMIAVPFVPPTYHNRVRLFAATAPTFFLLPMLGLHFILEKLNWKLLLQVPKGILLPKATWTVSILLAGFLIIGPLIVKAASKPTAYQEIACEQGLEAVYVRLNRGSRINIIQEHVFEIDWLPNFHDGKFKWYIHSMPHYIAIAEMEKFLPGFSIINALDIKTGRDLFLTMPTDQVPDEPALLGVCGSWSENPDVERYHFFYGENVTPDQVLK